MAQNGKAAIFLKSNDLFWKMFDFIQQGILLLPPPLTAQFVFTLCTFLLALYFHRYRRTRYLGYREQKTKRETFYPEKQLVDLAAFLLSSKLSQTGNHRVKLNSIESHALRNGKQRIKQHTIERLISYLNNNLEVADDNNK